MEKRYPRYSETLGPMEIEGFVSVGEEAMACQGWIRMYLMQSCKIVLNFYLSP